MSLPERTVSRMTLDETIKHCLEVAEENDLAAGTYGILAENNHNAYEKMTAETNSSRCAECAADHRQLAEWLTELKHLKAIIAGYGTVDRWKLDMILAMIRTESEDAWTRIEREKELAEAKRLLKLAVEDMTGMQFGKECKVCSKKLLNNECPIHNNVACILEKDFKWRYADEALKLIGGD